MFHTSASHTYNGLFWHLADAHLGKIKDPDPLFNMPVQEHHFLYVVP